MKISLILLIFLIFPLESFAYTVITKTIDGHKVRIFHISADDDYTVTVSVSNTGSTLKDLVLAVDWIAWINGAYFSPRDYTGQPDTTSAVRIMNGDWNAYSKYFPDTGVNGIFWFSESWSAMLVQNNIYSDKTLRDNYNSWRILEIENGIANFPILLANKKSPIARYNRAWLITEKMKVLGTKSFICRTAKNDIKMGTVEKISMMHLSEFIRKFWCIDAINLDNGGSLALYDDGKYIVGPGRNIMDAFVIVKK